MSAFATLSAKAPTAAPATMSRNTPTTRPTAHLTAAAPRPAAAASAMGFRPGGPFTSLSPATFSSTASSPCAMGGRHVPLSRGAQLVMRAQRQNSGEDRQLRRSSSKLDEDAPFMEPLLRNLVLGLGAGALAELAHVLITAFTTAQAAGGWSALPAALTAMLASKGDSPLQPLWYLDHSVAIATWALLYIFEARTVSSILDQHPGNPGNAAHAIRSTPTLPKRLMPLSLSGVKLALYRLITGVTPTTAASSAAAGSAAGERTPLMARHPSTERAASGALLTASSSSVLDRAPPTTESTTSTFPNSRSGSTTELPKVVTPLKPRGKLGGSGLRPMQKPEAPVAPGTPPKRESKREKELRERKAYLKNFWYAAAIASDVKEGQTKEVKMLGRTLVLFRDESGKVRALDSLCPHRGAPLSKGWLKDDKATGHKCVVCPYHGWAFDGTGTLKDVPSALDQGHLPKRPLVDAYPVEEKGGFVWLFFGSKSMPADERPPIPWVPELNSPDWQPVYAEMEFDAPHWSVFDNALDMAHIHYVHKDSFGNADKPEINDMTMSQDTFGVSGSFKIYNKPANPLMAWSKVPQVPVEVQAFLPMTSAVRITLAFGVQMITFVSTVPIDEHRSITRVALIRNFATTPLLDGFVKQNIFKIMKEDQEIVEGLNPDGVKHEVSLAPDLPQIAFRRLRQEWVDMGYAVDPSTTTRHDGSLNC